MSWRRFFRRAHWDRERADELQSYLEIEIEENRASGMSAEDAERAAHAKLGNVTRIREDIYEWNTLQPLDSWLRELRFAWRGVQRRPGFTAAVVVTLALGIGANTAIFAVVDNVLLKPLPYPEADRLIALRHVAPGLQAGEMAAAPSLYYTYRELGHALEHVGMWSAGGQTVSGLGEPEQARALWVTDGVLQALGIQPRVGRWITATEDAANYPGPQAVVITDAFWKRRFGADPRAVGRRVVIDSRPAEVVGIMPASFRFLNLQPQPDVILAMQLNRSRVVHTPPNGLASGPTPFGQGLARLRPGVTIEAANADASALLPRWLEMWPTQQGGFSRDAIAGWRLAPSFRPLKADVVGGVDQMLWILMGTIALVLLIACANVANLMLVRTASRRQEFAVRAALGAGGVRIAREVLIESVVLGTLGGAAGLVMAYGALRLIVAIGPSDLPRLDTIALDGRALLFAFTVSLCSSVVFGAVAAVKFAAPRNGLAIGRARGSGDTWEGHQTRHILVVVQVALALVLLVCAGLMIRTFNALRNVRPGFTNASQVQTMRVWMPESAVPDVERVTRAQLDVLRNVQAVPGVLSAGFASTIPLEGRPIEQAVFVEGQRYPAGTPPPTRRMKFVAPGFLAAMDTRIIAGRDLTAADLAVTARVALISENFAREVWGSAQAALGQQVHELGPPDRAPVWREIIGVVEDVHEDGLYQPAPTFVYWPIIMGDFFGQALFGVRNPVFAIRAAHAGTEALMQPVRDAVWSVNANLPVFLVRTMDDLSRESLAYTSFALVLLALASALALGLGVVGLYGVIAYVISQRAREIALRLALGAEPVRLRQMFAAQGLRLTGVGIVIGLVTATGVTQLMSSLLFGIGPVDIVTYAAVTATLLIVAGLASCLPTRRAAMTHPMTALMAE